MPTATVRSAKDEKSMSTNAREKIGVLLVHGVGEQGALQHLEKTAAKLVGALRVLPGDPRIDIRTPPRRQNGSATLRGVAPYDQEPMIAIDLSTDDQEATIELNEVWWADLDEPDGIVASIRFWLWGLGQWFAKRYEHSRRYDLKNRIVPTFPWERSGRFRRIFLPIINRGLLFLLSCFFLMLVATWSLGKYVMSIFKPKGIKPTILVQYIGDVKLYQQRRYGSGEPLTDIDQPPRTAITKRMVNALAGMALGRYDRWYIVAHSLGTVVAWDSLNQSSYALANCLSADIVEECRRKGLLRIGSGDMPALEHDRESIRPPRPRWIEAEEIVDRQALFSGLRGLCTYGSPLDKFAYLWPMIVAQHPDRTALRDDFEWVNVFDPTDPVAGAINAFQGIEEEREGKAARPWPANYGYRAFPLLLLSHIQYMSFDAAKKGRLINRLAAWILGDKRFDETEADTTSWMKPGEDGGAILRRYGLQGLQWCIAGGVVTLAFTSVILATGNSVAQFVEWLFATGPTSTGTDATASIANGPGPTWFESLVQTMMSVIVSVPKALLVVTLAVLACAFLLRLGEEIRHRRGKSEVNRAPPQRGNRDDDQKPGPDDLPKVA